MIRPIVLHPDIRLKKVCKPVSDFGEDLARLVEDMFATMYDAPGIGLAAPQVGIDARVLVMDCSGRDDEEDLPRRAMINPEVVWASEALNTHQEGCLSIPEFYADVTRPAEVRVAFTDPSGTAREVHLAGIEATCVQHEIDHLNGRLFIDYLGPTRRTLITQKMRKLKRERARGEA